MAFVNYYKVLGIKDYATAQEIKKAYRALAFRYHPDYNKGGSSGAERFRSIQEAYETLGNTVKRKQYDMQLRAQHLQAAGYGFSRVYGAPGAHEAVPGHEAAARPRPRQKATGWIKLLILIVITTGLMYLVMNPPAWLANIFKDK